MASGRERAARFGVAVVIYLRWLVALLIFWEVSHSGVLGAVRGPLHTLTHLGPAAQWALAATMATVLLRGYLHTLGAMLSVALRGLVLAMAIVLLVGASFGWLLRDYGFQNLFWSLGSPGGRWLVPLVSASMTVLTAGILWLDLYYIYTSRYDPALANPDLVGGDLSISAIDRERQQRVRARELWGRIARDGLVKAEKGDPGLFVLLASAPLVALLALPVLPAFAVAPSRQWRTPAGWLAGLGLGCAALVLTRFWVRRAGELVAGKTNVRQGAQGGMIPERTLIGPSVLALFSVPLVMGLTAAYAGDRVYGPARRSAGRLLYSVVPVVEVLGAVVLTLLWFRRLNGPRRMKVQAYGLIALLVVGSYTGAYLASRPGSNYGLASTYSLCCLLIFIGYLVILLYSESRLGRSQFRVQVVALALFAGVLWLNGVNEYKLRFAEIPGYPTLPAPLADASRLVSLGHYDGWLKADLTGVRFRMTPEGRRAAPGCDPCEFGCDSLIADREALRRWREWAGRTPAPSDEGGAGAADRRPKLVVVATSGGALRAAIWTAKVLKEIEREVPEFPARMRLVTGASGGMLGAAVYVGDLGLPPGVDSPRSMDLKGRGSTARSGAPLDERLQADFWTPALHQLVFGDVPSLPVPWALSEDRGTVLEERWRRAFPQLDRTFRDLRDGLGPRSVGWTLPREADGALPSLVFTPMLAEDSRRLFVSNLRLSDLVLNHGRFDPVSGRDRYRLGDGDFPYYSQMGVEMFTLLPAAYPRLPLSTAVRMSATFPLISPAVSLPTLPARSVVDAGYYDNYGVDLAVSWLERHRAWLEANTSGVMLIQIRAFTNEESLKRLDRGAAAHDAIWGFVLDWLAGPMARGAGFLTTPLSGVARARQLVMSYRNDNAVAHLKRRFTLDKLQEATGVTPATCYEEDWERCFSAEQVDRLAEEFDRAQMFFRVITFTCGEESRDRSGPEMAGEDRATGATGGPAEVVELAEVETMNWMVSAEEHRQISAKWRTKDNRDRFGYLLGFFGRTVADDAPASAQRFEAPAAGGWRPRSLAGYGDDHHVRDVMPGGEGAPARWTFEGLPEGEYVVSATWPKGRGHARRASYRLLDGDEPIGPPVEVDQRREPGPEPGAGGKAWRILGDRRRVGSGRLTVVLEGGGAGRLVADAIRVNSVRLGGLDRVCDDDPATFAAPGWTFHDSKAQGGGPGARSAVGGGYSSRDGGADSPPASWVFEDMKPGDYEVYATWPGATASGRWVPPEGAGAAAYTATLGTSEVWRREADQATAPFRDAGRGDYPASLGRPWRRIGRVAVPPRAPREPLSNRLVIEVRPSGAGRVFADAVRLDRVRPEPVREGPQPAARSSRAAG